MARPRPHREPLLVLLAAAATLALLALWATASGSAPAPATRIAERLGLTRYSLQHLHGVRRANAIHYALELAGRRVTLRLEPRSLRSAGFRVLEQRADGSLAETAAPAPLTYRGTVPELPGAVVGATVRAGLLDAVVALEDGRLFYVQPAGESTGDGAAHAVYAADSVSASDVACATTESAVAVPDAPEGTSAVAAIRVADLAIDADYELFVKNGNSTSATVSDVETVMNAVNVVYERDCSITHRLVTVIVRSSASDPYGATDAGAALDELRAHWNAQHTSIVRDVVHLMTGRELDGNTIGIASVGVICSGTRAYGLSQTRYTTTLSRRASLTAHELGHNWNASHCDAAVECHVMCSSLGGCDGLGLPEFEPVTIQAIGAFAATRSCLSTPTMAVDGGALAPAVRLAAPHPSPFSRATQLRFYLERPGSVRLAIYDVAGQRVATLVEGSAGAGWHTQVWNGTDARGGRVRAGVFYARLESAGGARTQKLVFVK